MRSDEKKSREMEEKDIKIVIKFIYDSYTKYKNTKKFLEHGSR